MGTICEEPALQLITNDELLPGWKLYKFRFQQKLIDRYVSPTGNIYYDQDTLEQELGYNFGKAFFDFKTMKVIPKKSSSRLFCRYFVQKSVTNDDLEDGCKSNKNASSLDHGPTFDENRNCHPNETVSMQPSYIVEKNLERDEEIQDEYDQEDDNDEYEEEDDDEYEEEDDNDDDFFDSFEDDTDKDYKVNNYKLAEEEPVASSSTILTRSQISKQKLGQSRNNLDSTTGTFNNQEDEMDLVGEAAEGKRNQTNQDDDDVNEKESVFHSSSKAALKRTRQKGIDKESPSKNKDEKSQKTDALDMRLLSKQNDNQIKKRKMQPRKGSTSKQNDLETRNRLEADDTTNDLEIIKGSQGFQTAKNVRSTRNRASLLSSTSIIASEDKNLMRTLESRNRSSRRKKDTRKSGKGQQKTSTRKRGKKKLQVMFSCMQHVMTRNIARQSKK